MKKTAKLLFFSIFFVSLILLIAGCKSRNYDDFAKCLTEKGVKMYGAYWCPHCQTQKDSFGDSWQYINYIECSLPGGKVQTEVCSQAEIKAYPTWEFPGGERKTGEISFAELSQRSGCGLK